MTSSMQPASPRDASNVATRVNAVILTNLGKFGLMTLKCPRKFALLALAQSLALLTATCLAQEPVPDSPTPKTPPLTQAPQVTPPPPVAPKTAQVPVSEAPAVIRLNPTLVVLPVTVKDHNGNLVPDLKKDEFLIFEE